MEEVQQLQGLSMSLPRSPDVVAGGWVLTPSVVPPTGPVQLVSALRYRGNVCGEAAIC